MTNMTSSSSAATGSLLVALTFPLKKVYFSTTVSRSRLLSCISWENFSKKCGIICQL